MLDLVGRPQILPFAPRPHNDELLISWLLRIATANQLQFHELFPGLAAMDTYRLNVDPGDRAVEVLAACTRLDTQIVESLLLKSRYPLLAGVSFLFLPDEFRMKRLGNPDHRHLPSACIYCLANGERLASSVYWEAESGLPTSLLCPRHGMWLEHICPGCGIHKLELSYHRDRHLLRCNYCTWRPVKVATTRYPASSPSGRNSLLFRIQRDIATALRGHSPTGIWGESITAEEFLAMFDDLYWLLRTPEIHEDAVTTFVFIDWLHWICASALRPSFIRRVLRWPFPTWSADSRVELLLASAVVILGNQASAVLGEKVDAPMLSPHFPWDDF